MLIIGAAHIALDLVDFGNQFNFETIVIDPRGLFAAEDRFSSKPGHLYRQWPEEILPDLKPDEDTYAVLLTHDPKIDDAALEILLNSNVPYIGALGSSKTHQKRIGRLKSKGFSDEQIDRIHSPIGLDIKALSAKEIALSVMAEVIQVRNTKYT